MFCYCLTNAWQIQLSLKLSLPIIFPVTKYNLIAPRINYDVVIGLTPSRGDLLWIRRGLVNCKGVCLTSRLLRLYFILLLFLYKTRQEKSDKNYFTIHYWPPSTLSILHFFNTVIDSVLHIFYEPSKDP